MKKTILGFTLLEITVSMFVIMTAASTALVCLRKLQPTVKCCALKEDVLSGKNPFDTWCSSVVRRQIAANGWVDAGINFGDMRACQRFCGTNSAPAFGFLWAADEPQRQGWPAAPLDFAFVSDESQIPAGEERVSTDVWSSTDLYDWSYYCRLGTSDDGDWMEVVLEPTNTVRFFRVVEVYDLPRQ